MVFESYFLYKNYVTLTYADLQNLDARYARRLFAALQKYDEITAKRQREAMRR